MGCVCVTEATERDGHPGGERERVFYKGRPGLSGHVVACGRPVETFVRWLVPSGLGRGAGTRRLGKHQLYPGNLLPGRPVGLWHGCAIELLRRDVSQGHAVSWMYQKHVTFLSFWGVKSRTGTTCTRMLCNRQLANPNVEPPTKRSSGPTRPS